jgi:RHS repeat-associated protein
MNLRSLLTCALLAIVGLLGAGEVFAARTTTYLHNDGLGSVVAATNEAGQVLWRKNYAPFGEQMNPPSTTVRTAYTGKDHDEAIGLSNFGARQYDPETGRFLSVDPVGFVETNPMSFNRYLYVNNNPYKHVDPDGEFVNFAAKFVFDVGVNIAINYVTTGEMDVGGALKDSAVGLLNPAKILANAAKLAKVMGGVRKAAGKAGDAGGRADPDFDTTRRAAFEKAGMTDPDKVSFSKMDPKTGTVVEFKGEGGAKIGYDGPHQSPGPHHDKQHISWQSAGKRGGGGARRGNEPYSGPQHPSRPDRKDQ